MVALFGFSSAVMAQEGSVAAAGQQAPIEHYTYATHLDIAKVIAEDAVPNVCAVVPEHMTYEDSQGKRHVLEYLVMGNGCSS